MSLFKKIFKKKEEEIENLGGMQDFMTLIRVYFQAQLAGNLGITNINSMPDLAAFKRGLKIPTQGNKLGIAEKSVCKKMLTQGYNISDTFYKEIDNTIRKNCRNLNQVQPFMYQFQAFSGDLMMQVGTIMKWKFRVPNFLKKALYSLTQDTVHKIMTNNTWKDESSYKTVFNIRQMNARLGFSEEWMTEYVFNMVRLAKKEPRPKEDINVER